MENYYSVLKQTGKVWTEFYRSEKEEIAKEQAHKEYMKDRKNRVVVDEYHPYYFEDEILDEKFVATVWDSDNIAPWED